MKRASFRGVPFTIDASLRHTSPWGPFDECLPPCMRCGNEDPTTYSPCVGCDLVPPAPIHHTAAFGFSLAQCRRCGVFGYYDRSPCIGVRAPTPPWLLTYNQHLLDIAAKVAP